MAVSIGVSCASCASGVVGTGVMETGLLLAFFLALVAGGCSVMCAGKGAVTDLGMNTAGVVCRGWLHVFCRRADADLSSAFFGDFFFLRVTSIQSSAFFGWAWSGSFSGAASLTVTVETVVAAVSVATVAAAASGGSFFGAKLPYVSQLLTAPTSQASAFHNYHHLPFSADNGFRNCLKTLPSQTHPERVVPVGRPGCRPKQVYRFDVSIRAEERGQHFTCYKLHLL